MALGCDFPPGPLYSGLASEGMAEVPSQALVFDLVLRGKCPNIQQVRAVDSERLAGDCGPVRPLAAGDIVGARPSVVMSEVTEGDGEKARRGEATCPSPARERLPVWACDGRGLPASLLPCPRSLLCLHPHPTALPILQSGTEIRDCQVCPQEAAVASFAQHSGGRQGKTEPQEGGRDWTSAFQDIPRPRPVSSVPYSSPLLIPLFPQRPPFLRFRKSLMVCLRLG